MNKEIKIFNNFIGSSLYHVAGYIVLAAILNIGFNIIWWLRFGEWANDCIAIWLRMISINIPKLNTVILASPKSDVEQSVGRIFREKACDRTHHPLIIDIIDDFSLFKKQAEKRQKLYNKNNYKIYLNGSEYVKPTRKKKVKKIHEIDECLI